MAYYLPEAPRISPEALRDVNRALMRDVEEAVHEEMDAPVRNWEHLTYGFQRMDRLQTRIEMLSVRRDRMTKPQILTLYLTAGVETYNRWKNANA